MSKDILGRDRPILIQAEAGPEYPDYELEIPYLLPSAAELGINISDVLSPYCVPTVRVSAREMLCEKYWAKAEYRDCTNKRWRCTSRKRFVKILMAYGFDRNQANDWARDVQQMRMSYQEELEWMRRGGVLVKRKRRGVHFLGVLRSLYSDTNNWGITPTFHI